MHQSGASAATPATHDQRMWGMYTTAAQPSSTTSPNARMDERCECECGRRNQQAVHTIHLQKGSGTWNLDHLLHILTKEQQ